MRLDRYYRPWPTLTEPLRRACLCRQRLSLPIPRRRGGHQAVQQLARGRGDSLYRRIEGLSIRLGRTSGAAELPDELQGGGLHFVIGRRWGEVVESLDISAHKLTLKGFRSQ